MCGACCWLTHLALGLDGLFGLAEQRHHVGIEVGGGGDLVLASDILGGHQLDVQPPALQPLAEGLRVGVLGEEVRGAEHVGGGWGRGRGGGLGLGARALGLHLHWLLVDDEIGRSSSSSSTGSAGIGCAEGGREAKSAWVRYLRRMCSFKRNCTAGLSVTYVLPCLPQAAGAAPLMGAFGLWA